MARTRFKCHFIIYICFLLSVTVRSLPIRTTTQTTDSANSNVSQEIQIETVQNFTKEVETITNKDAPVNRTLNSENRSVFRQNVRPGQTASKYEIHIKRNGANFEGRALIEVQLTTETRTSPIFFNMLELTVTRVQLGILTSVNAVNANFRIVNQGLEITLPQPQTATSYVVIVEYNAPLRTNGFGLFMGKYDEADYIAMNLYPTNARRLFPSMDEPNLSAITSFTFEGFEYENIVFNTALVANSQTQFTDVEGANYLWGMVAHNFANINRPVQDVLLYVRPGITNQDGQAAVAINNYYNALNTWTQRPYNEIMANQDGNMHVFALPDVSRDWYSLSTVCVWEPYMLMETIGSVTQRKLVILNIAQAMSRQWFGYTLRPENWRFEWVVSGLGTYAAYDIAKEFQTHPQGENDSLLDMNTIFTTDIIQESLLLDSFANSPVIEPAAEIFAENAIRLHKHGLIQYKAAALLRMLKLIISDDDSDIIQGAARALFSTRALQSIDAQIFYDAINGIRTNNNLINNINTFMQTWIANTGYPVIDVVSRVGGVVITQERFGFSSLPPLQFTIPITYTTSINPNFENLRPTMMMTATASLDFDLGDDGWVLLNLQGQSYYRVNYNNNLWDRIIMALSDPETRERIHPLNRASLLDDSLNFARAGKIDYDVPFRIALTMEHELNYGVWRAFVRNMDFLRKRLIPFVQNDDNLDDQIYVRMIRRTVTLVEEELGFEPDNAVTEPAMQSMTRGLVMDHACRSGYDPCIAAAVDLFFSASNPDVVNPNIPREIRPAVYCTMVRTGEEDIREALLARMELEASSYERLVILQSLACSQDEEFINAYLAETIAANSPYNMAEKLKIFEAVASSDIDNTRRALDFMTKRTNEIRNMYGGPDKLEEAIFILADNIVTAELENEFSIWVNSLDSISNLGNSNTAAIRARSIIRENLAWNNYRMQNAYDWINANHAPTILLSTFVLTLSLLITLFNY